MATRKAFSARSLRATTRAVTGRAAAAEASARARSTRAGRRRVLRAEAVARKNVDKDFRLAKRLCREAAAQGESSIVTYWHTFSSRFSARHVAREFERRPALKGFLVTVEEMPYDPEGAVVGDAVLAVEPWTRLRVRW